MGFGTLLRRPACAGRPGNSAFPAALVQRFPPRQRVFAGLILEAVT